MMKINITPTIKEGPNPYYKSIPLLDLISLIAEKSDHNALEEFHRRPMFKDIDKGGLTCCEYIQRLHEKTYRTFGKDINALDIADIAYDLTVDKFSNLPTKNNLHLLKNTKNTPQMKLPGSNCRLYFMAYLKFVKKSFQDNPPQSEIEREDRAVTKLHGLLKVQFYRSRLEAERKVITSWSRYCWRLNEQNIYIWLPLSLKGNDRKKWLEENIPNPDPLKPDESMRIQSIINRYFNRGSHFSFNDHLAQQNDHDAIEYGELSKISGIFLAMVVAEEKALNINKQRPGIKRLGTIKLKKLIEQIFNEIRDSCYRDANIANKYGLSKSTFSRFAGSHWRDSKSNSIPDLWMNTAKVLATHSAFKELSIRSGVWDQVKATLEGILPERPSNE